VGEVGAGPSQSRDGQERWAGSTRRIRKNSSSDGNCIRPYSCGQSVERILGLLSRDPGYHFVGPSSWLSRPLLNPFSELPPLLPDVHKVWPRFQHAERVAHKTLICRPRAVREALLALPLDFAGPDAPLQGAQRTGRQDQPEEDDEGRDDGFDDDVHGERNSRGWRRGQGGGGRRADGL